MGKSLFKAIRNIFVSKKNEVADMLSDPIRDGKIAIDDSKKQIADFTKQIASIMAETKLLEKKRNDAEKNVEKWQSLAQKAASTGNEDDARKFLESKNSAKKEMDSYQTEIDKSNALIAKLKEQLNSARNKLAKAESNITRLEARSKSAKLRQDFAKASSEFNTNNSALAALDDLENEVNKEEAEAEAWEELVEGETDSSADALAEKYSVSDSEVEDELAALMKSSKKK